MDAESMMMPASRKKGGNNKARGRCLPVVPSFADRCPTPRRAPRVQSNKDSVAAALILARYYDEPQLAVYVRPLSF